MVSKSVVFLLTARADLSEEEKHNVEKYKLGGEVIYNSESSKKHLDKGTLAGLALAKMSLNVTVNSLTRGQTINCSTLDEVLAAESAVREACEALKTYLDVAATFDGREEVVEF